MKRIVSVFAVNVLAVSCAQKADDSAGSESAGLSAPKVLGTVLTCKSSDNKVISSLRLERGIGGRIWLKGRVKDDVGVPLDVNAMVSKVVVSGNKSNQPRFNLDQYGGLLNSNTLKAPPTDDEGYKGYMRNLATVAWDSDKVVLTNFDNSRNTLDGECSSQPLIRRESDSRGVKPKLVWPELESIFELDCRDGNSGPIPIGTETEGGVCTPSGRLG